MSFVDNLRNGLANWLERNQSNTQHASDITDAQKDSWAQQRIDNLRKYAGDGGVYDYMYNSLQDASEKRFYEDPYYSGFHGPWADDTNYESVMYDFNFMGPTSAEGDPRSENQGRRSGKVLVRMPRNRDTNSIPYGDVGVYGAVLDDGTQLDYEQFKDFMAANESSFRFASPKSGSEYLATDNGIDELRKYAEDSQRAYWDKYGDTSRTPYWDKKARAWNK